MEKPILNFISDLHGLQNAEWMEYYYSSLEPYFTMRMIDSLLLAGIERHVFSEKEIHRAFLSGGLDTAANRLRVDFPEKAWVLAFSIGGTIAWKAALSGWNYHRNFTISSTRIRLEEQVPQNIPILVFGNQDPNAPALSWFEEHRLQCHWIAGGDHEFYKEPVHAAYICEQLIDFSTQSAAL